jgi:hypothetical protein
MGGLVGFDYERCAKVAKVYGYDFWDPEFLDLFQVIEDEFVEATNARIKAAMKSGEGSNTQG